MKLYLNLRANNEKENSFSHVILWGAVLVRGNIGAWAAADKMPDSRLAKQETTPAPKPAIDIDELKK
ncbi:MAG: hypothetical protein Q4D17_05735 [Planctomycetia bacterium]|nr:hypothetical protein [Planctomycetia bacterium]